MKASAAKEIVLITAKQTGDGYQWVIKFNKGHAPHENMIFWFALPSDQVPVGRTDFVTVNADGRMYNGVMVRELVLTNHFLNVAIWCK